MSDAMDTGVGPDPEELSNEELLERIAALDPNKYDTVRHAQRALAGQEGSS